MKKTLIAFSACFISMFVLGGLWNGLIMSDFYVSNAPSIIRPPEEFNLAVIAVGYLALTAIMTFITVVNMSENPRFVGGFLFGATFGLAATLPLYLILYGRWDFSFTYAVVDTGWHFIEQGIGGWILTNLYFRLGQEYNATSKN